MPYPNIFALHQLSADPRRSRSPGRCRTGYDRTHAHDGVRVREPGADRRARHAVDLMAAEPTLTATARGHVDYGRTVDNWVARRARRSGDTPFERGWAFVTAAAVNFTATGQLQTYTWSRWACLTDRRRSTVGTLSP